MIATTNWSFEFDETGGYDCITSAIHIKHRHQIIITLDFSVFNQEHYSFPPPSWMVVRGTNLASFITRCLNEVGIVP